MTNMELTDSSHKRGHDWLQSVKTHVKSLFLQLVGCFRVCVIGCAGPLPFSVVVSWGFFPLTHLSVYCLCLLEDTQAT